MLLLSCSRLSRGFDEGPLFENVGFELQAGERAGLVGPNGAGKTTLLRILAGLDRPDDGSVRLHAGARVALLRQQPVFAPGRTLFAEARSALDELLAAHDDMVRTAEALARATDEAEHKTLAARYDRLNEVLRHHDAYNVDHRVEKILDGLGLQEEDYERPVSTFSGGQQSRLMLAKLLLSAPDVMLLDEPSNHLDIDATRWLEDYLAEQPNTIDVPHMHFGEVRRSGDVVLQVDDLAKAYDRPLFAGLSFQLQRGKRLGIMGPNGSGKTTLLRILLGEEVPDAGTVQRGHLIDFGYYDQHLKELPNDKPVIRAVWPEDDPEFVEQRMRDLLGRFGLVGD